MSLEASVRQVREFAKTFEAVTAIGDALEDVLVAERRLASAEKRLIETEKSESESFERRRIAIEEAVNLKAQATAELAAAKAEAAAIRKEAKEKADATVAKAKERADSIAEAAATAAEKFDLQKKTNDEVLEMLGAQIAHGEAKLTEIREAIARLTKA